MWVKARGAEGDVGGRRRGRGRLPRRRPHRLADADHQGTLLADQLHRRLPRHGGRLHAVPRHQVFRLRLRRRIQGERAIDCQDWSATQYVGTTMNGNPTVFGVNFADGRIKGYPQVRSPAAGAAQALRPLRPRQSGLRQERFPRQRRRHDHRPRHGPDVVQGRQRQGHELGGRPGLGPGEEQENYLGHDDWRLPNAKELQSIVDYTRAPAVTHSPAIDPLFEITQLADGEYPFFWTGTTHLDGPPDRQGSAAVYVSFGRALGWMQFPPGRGRLSPARRPRCRGAAERSQERRPRRLSRTAAGRRATSSASSTTSAWCAAGRGMNRERPAARTGGVIPQAVPVLKPMEIGLHRATRLQTKEGSRFKVRARSYP